MGADGTREYAFTAAWLRVVGGSALVALAMIGISVYAPVPVTGTSLDRWTFLVPLVAVAALGWTVTRTLVRSATLRGRRLRVRTVLSSHEFDVDQLTEISWRVGEDRIGGLNPLNRITARLRHRGRTLRVLMPAGAALLRDLEAVRSGGGPDRAPGDGEAREFDFTARVETGWTERSTMIRYATLDDGCLRAVTGDGREHTVRLADIDEVEYDVSRPRGLPVAVRHGGEVLGIPMPSGAELADRLSAAVPGR